MSAYAIGIAGRDVANVKGLINGRAERAKTRVGRRLLKEAGPPGLRIVAIYRSPGRERSTSRGRPRLAKVPWRPMQSSDLALLSPLLKQPAQ